MLLPKFCIPLITLIILSVLLSGAQAPDTWQVNYQEWINGHPSVGGRGKFPVVNPQALPNNSDYNYGAMLNEATVILDTQHKAFVDKILKSVYTALNGREVDYVRIIGTGSMNPLNYKKIDDERIDITSALFQTALGFKIYRTFGTSKTKLLFQEKAYTPGENKQLSAAGTVLSANEFDLGTIPPSATPGNGVTIAFMLGGDVYMTLKLLYAYRSIPNNFIFIGDNVNAMDKAFFDFVEGLFREKNYPIDLTALKLYRDMPSWKSIPFPESPIYRLFACQDCPIHTRNAVQWFKN